MCWHDKNEFKKLVVNKKYGENQKYYFDKIVILKKARKMFNFFIFHVV